MTPRGGHFFESGKMLSLCDEKQDLQIAYLQVLFLNEKNGGKA